MRNYLILFLLLFATISFATNSLAIYPFSSPQQQQRFQQLTYQLRCLVCQNQNLAESDASLAADLRTQIAEKIRAGASDQEIIQYLVARYGDFVLYQPPVMQSTYLLWFGPFVLLLIGLAILMLRIRYLNKKSNSMNLTIEKEQHLERLLRNE